MKTKIIGLYGGPGVGKSTLAAEIFLNLKKMGKSVELVREYVKDWAWNEKRIRSIDQLYLLGKQSHKESILYDKVDYVITDAPLLLNGFYSEYYFGKSYLTEAVKAFISHSSKELGVCRRNIFINSYISYSPNGRYQTEEEAERIHHEMRKFVMKHSSHMYNYTRDISSEQLTQKILEMFNESNTNVQNA